MSCAFLCIKNKYTITTLIQTNGIGANASGIQTKSFMLLFTLAMTLILTVKIQCFSSSIYYIRTAFTWTKSFQTLQVNRKKVHFKCYKKIKSTRMLQIFLISCRFFESYISTHFYAVFLIFRRFFSTKPHLNR